MDLLLNAQSLTHHTNSESEKRRQGITCAGLRAFERTAAAGGRRKTAASGWETVVAVAGLRREVVERRAASDGEGVKPPQERGRGCRRTDPVDGGRRPPLVFFFIIVVRLLREGEAIERGRRWG